MRHYELHFQNPSFFIAKKSVDGLIRALMTVDPNLRFSRGKVKNGHIVYFDSEIEDQMLFRKAIEDYIIRNKYNQHHYVLMVTKRSNVGRPEDPSRLRENLIKTFEEFEMYEGTSNYWPGYSDDGTADTLADIRAKTSEIHNEELRKKEKEVMGFDSSINTKEENEFWQKWMYANMITTSLQDGFYIKPDLLEKALRYYKETLETENIEEIFKEQTDSLKEFKTTISIIIEELEKELKDPHTEGPNYEEIGKYYYAPGFLDKDREPRKDLDNGN